MKWLQCRSMSWGSPPARCERMRWHLGGHRKTVMRWQYVDPVRYIRWER